MIRRPPRSTLSSSSAASDVYKRQAEALNLGEAGVMEALAHVFAELGFAPEAADGGLALHACPFLDDARRHPEVVCGVHRGLTVGIARRAGASVAVSYTHLRAHETRHD